MNLRTKRIVKTLLPQSIQDVVGLYRSRTRTLEGHRRLERLAFELGPEHVANTRVYAGRIELLQSFKKGGTFAEIGVNQGRFSEAILKHCQPRRLYLIDIWNSPYDIYGKGPLKQVESRFSAQIRDGSVVILRGWSADMIKLLDDQSLDCIYIDADHSYDGVRRDLLSALPKMKPGAVIAGHDYVKWSSPAGRFGVVEAVNEFCVNNRYELIGLTVQKNMHLSYAIRPMQIWSEPDSAPSQAAAGVVSSIAKDH